MEKDISNAKQKAEKMFEGIEKEKSEMKEERLKLVETFAKLLSSWLIKIEENWEKMIAKIQGSDLQNRMTLTQGNKNTENIAKGIEDIKKIKEAEKTEVRKVHVENQIVIPKTEFPKTIKISNLPESEVPAMIKTIEDLVAFFKRGIELLPV